MKHEVELKMPKLFGKNKKSVNETEEEVEKLDGKMEIKHSVEIKLPELFSKKTVDETGEEVTESNGKKIMIMSGVVVASLTMGYLLGHHRGASRAPNNIFITK